MTIPSAGAVPYSGATQGVDLGVYDLKVNGLTIGRGGGNVDGNTANGSMSLYSNSSGNSNTAYGYASLYSNTTGSSNIANGNQSLYFNTTGSNNTAIGNASLNSNSTGEDNTANGFGALYKNTGSNNTASGSRSLYSNTTGGSNTALGYSTGTTNTTGNQNTFIGYSADVSSNNLSNATALGYGANVAASNSIQLGNTSVTDVKTSGTITAGTVKYPNTDGTNGQVLTTNGAGVPTWTTPSSGGGGGGSGRYLGEDYLGGIIFYLYTNASGTQKGLIVSKTETSGALMITTATAGANSLGNGAFNTNLLPSDSPAKIFAASLGPDWYIPSVDELVLLFQNRFHVSNSTATGVTPLNGGYGEAPNYGWAWSSTERGSNLTQAFIFNIAYGGNASTLTKTNTTRFIRAIRSF